MNGKKLMTVNGLHHQQNTPVTTIQTYQINHIKSPEASTVTVVATGAARTHKAHVSPTIMTAISHELRKPAIAAATATAAATITESPVKMTNAGSKICRPATSSAQKQQNHFQALNTLAMTVPQTVAISAAGNEHIGVAAALMDSRDVNVALVVDADMHNNGAADEDSNTIINHNHDGPKGEVLVGAAFAAAVDAATIYDCDMISPASYNDVTAKNQRHNKQHAVGNCNSLNVDSFYQASETTIKTAAHVSPRSNAQETTMATFPEPATGGETVATTAIKALTIKKTGTTTINTMIPTATTPSTSASASTSTLAIVTTCTTSTTATNGSDNHHKINNYEIHQQPHVVHQPKQMQRRQHQLEQQKQHGTRDISAAWQTTRTTESSTSSSAVVETTVKATTSAMTTMTASTSSAHSTPTASPTSVASAATIVNTTSNSMQLRWCHNNAAFAAQRAHIGTASIRPCPPAPPVASITPLGVVAAAAVAAVAARPASGLFELASPRCQSRESNVSCAAAEGRCPSSESNCSGNDGTGARATAPMPNTPPVGLPLPATLAPAAAAALLPPQSAAMAAYLNAAAVAAQQNHLLLTNPLAAAASLVHQATQSHSPGSTHLTTTISSSPVDEMADGPALDFSLKRRRESDLDESDDDNTEDGGNELAGIDEMPIDLNSPLDLSVSRKRQSSNEDASLPVPKSIRANQYKVPAPGTWVPPINPYLAAVAAASLSPKTPLSPLEWGGKHKILPNEATKALEKMTEMTRLGSATDSAELPMRQVSTAIPLASNTNNSTSRHSAWQSHWLNKGADSVKDVFKCVWCKQSFPTLASLTVHMKETQHCGVNVPASVSGSTSTPTNSGSNQTVQSPHHMRHSAASMHSGSTNGASSSALGTATASTAATTTTSTSNKSDLNLLIKETMPLPRKLVRGQDVWLGKGAEQTREILKCMWCGQSFRSLAEMTSHMQETQHYTNIISQEQIISWKSSDEKAPSIGSNPNGSSTSPAVTSPTAPAIAPPAPATSSVTSSATVCAVLTCKVCDQAFPSLKELSNHMVKNSHYKEHMIRPTGNDNAAPSPRRGRQMREKRKKSLPVRKLLELERAQQEYKNNSLDSALKPLRDFTVSTKITCEKCGDKIETAVFVDHIRQCLGGMLPTAGQRVNNHFKQSFHTTMNSEQYSPQAPSNRSDGRKTVDDNVSPILTKPDILYPLAKDGEKNSSSTPSVLNAIEQLIEKSFDTRSRHSGSAGGVGGGSQRSTPLGSSILKRLGIDDSVDYTKPLIDAQALNFMRSFSNYSGRDRSASESSSVSERCNSRVESFTPERHMEHSRFPTPQTTVDKPTKTTSHIDAGRITPKEAPELIHIKSEPVELNNDALELTVNAAPVNETSQKISVKREFTINNDLDDIVSRQRLEILDYKRKSITPGSRAISPSASERSLTPKSTTSSADKRYPTTGGSSLTALSCMFDSLNNMNTNSANLTGAALVAVGETNNNNGKKSNANPLAALQKLCETTEKPTVKTRSCMNSSSTTQANINSGAGINNNTFSWACNEAVSSGSESVIKCSQCDAVFNSKGAYRHHFSKMHYVKEEAIVAPSNANISKSPSLSISPKSAAGSPKSASKSPMAISSPLPPSNNNINTPIINPYNESSQSKFLKYTELAKQLSSKNA